MKADIPERFGLFQVLGVIGSGGMGAVYRARDPRLNRDVAIKVLTRAGSDPARQRRFTEEAQAASALNHPNIVTVYDVGVHDGVPFIVSELVDGESIRQRLARGPLPVREVLDLAVQMADGLAAAHQARIVHRDVKPENVMVTHEGHVKVLDFGLAVVGTHEGSAPYDATMTSTGIIIGTVPYMSPEQARGASVDHRTDQFSLGLTLYEMLTGQRAFRRDSAAQTLTAIIEDEPEAVTKLNARVPAPLRWTIERCLAKDPRQRYESTADLARELRTLRDRLNEFTPAEAAPADVARHRPIVALLVVSVAIAAASVAGVALWAGGAPGQTLDDYRFTPFATDAGYQSSAAWSPDGKTLAYIAAVDGVLQVFTKAVGSTGRSQVTHTKFDCQQVFWAPDGTRLYYVSLAKAREGLWSISAVGGDPELVMENVWRAAIAPDGKTLALLRALDVDYGGVKTIWLSSPPGDAPTEYTRGSFAHRKFFEGSVNFSPDGSKLGAWITETPTGPTASGSGKPIPAFWVLPLATGQPHVVPSPTPNLPNYAATFSWFPDSRHIVSALPYPRPGVHLWLTDTESSETRLITASASIENDPDVSPAGTRIAMTFQQADYDVYRISSDHPVPEPVIASSRNEMDPAWSGATSQMAFTTDRSGENEIWLRSQNGDFERPLVTPSDFRSHQTYLLSAPTFSPDGQRIAYYREGSDGNRIWMSPTAGGPPVEVFRADNGQDLPDWSPDGAWIAYPQDSAGVIGKWSLAKSRVGAKIEPVVLVPNIVPYSPVKWARSGDWIAFNGVGGLSIVSADGKETRVINEEPLLAFDWSDDGRRVFGIRQSDDFRHLTFTSIDIASRTERVINPDMAPLPIAAQPVRGFARVSGTTFVTSIVHVSSDIWLLDGFNSPAPGIWTLLARRFQLRR
jgi:Tol biopolymer transport system component/tRNA A-37 threonylcarbamoyl transferase component Bud32